MMPKIPRSTGYLAQHGQPDPVPAEQEALVAAHNAALITKRVLLQRRFWISQK